MNNKKNQKTLNSSRRWTFILIFLILLFLLLSITYGKNIYGSIINGIQNITGINRITAPEISGGSSDWQNSAIIYVSKDSITRKGLDYYNYCITTEAKSSNCSWIRTDTKNVKISESGHYYIFFRGVDINNKSSNDSNREEVFIDNDNPIIDSVDINKTSSVISVRVNAKEELSGIKAYYFSIDGKNFLEGENNYEFNGLKPNTEYTIYVKVEDNTGNVIETSQKVKTNKIDDNSANGENSATDKNSENKTNNNDTKVNESSSNDSQNNENWDLPKISLNGVKSSFEYGTDYALPSSYSFGNDTGNYYCTVDNDKETSTKYLKVGNHHIECSITSSHGKNVIISKDIEVTLKDDTDKIMDGYILYHLYYPDDSINREWRLGNEDVIRTGYDNTGWEAYTGPILVKISDMSNIYIRYDLNGVSHVVAPNGKLSVDIVPNSYSLNDQEKTSVVINYDDSASIKEYQINGGNWQEYTGPFEVGPNTLIDAQASKDEDVYNSDGVKLYTHSIKATDSVFVSQIINDTTHDAKVIGSVNGSSTGTLPYTSKSVIKNNKSTTTAITNINVTTPVIGSSPTTSIAGPTISEDQTAIVDKVNITLSTSESARKVYYSIDGDNYKEYTGKFSITNNCEVSAYYIRDSDGKESKISRKYISNIRQANLPYLAILTDPENTIYSSSIKITLLSKNYKTLEYSFDGVYYQSYNEPFTINNSATIYAKAVNNDGTTFEKRTIVMNEVPVVTNDLMVSISTDENSNVLQDKVKVTIDYDISATTKVYKIGSDDTWHNYSEPFEVTSNKTIYAYASNAAGSGYDSKIIDFLSTGMVDPKINVIPQSPLTAYQVNIKIDYADTANIKKYKIDNGEYQNYTEPFIVDHNCIVTAYAENTLHQSSIASTVISNVIPRPTIVALDKGMYYLIKLNYPNTSSSREYKWKENGSWKEYNSDGILLIKSQYKDIVLSPTGTIQIKIENDNGKQIDFNGDYYILDTPTSEIMANLFIRWDTKPPATPDILLSTSDWNSEVGIGINYPSNMKRKLYKIVNPDGTQTDWLDYTNNIIVTNDNTIIYAKCQNNLEVWSSVVSKKITNIDENKPEIQNLSLGKSSTSTISPIVNGSDNESGVKYYYYSIDGINYIKTLTSSYTFSNLDANTDYTIYIKIQDNVGNISDVSTIDAKTKDIAEPVISFDPSINTWSTSKKMLISCTDDNLTIMYSLDNKKTWINYTDELTIDKNTNIFARTTDGTNEKIINSSITTIDKTKPIVNSASIIARSSRLIVNTNATDNESGIKKYYYSIDGINYNESFDNKFTFANLTNNTEYKVYIKVENSAGIMSDVYETSGKTLILDNIEYEVSPDNNTWGYTKTVTINYPKEENDTYIRQYSLDNGNNWVDYTEPVVLSNEGSIIARLIDGSNIKIASSFTVSKID
jgi:hypothetical protein